MAPDDMDTRRIVRDVGSSPRIRVSRVGGSLRLIGGEGTRLEAQADEASGISVRQEGEIWDLRAASDCSLFVPHQSRIEIESVGGDGRVRGLGQDLLLRSVGGDLELRRVGKVSLGQVGGDLTAARVDGDLMADRVGGDATLIRVSGVVHLRSVGGDARLRGAGGAVIRAAGDLSAELCPSAGWKGSLESGGDLILRMCQEASGHFRYEARGDVRLPVGAPKAEKGEFVLGSAGGVGQLAEAEIELAAGGDLLVSLVAREELEAAADIEDKVFGHVEDALHRVEILSARAGRITFDGEAMGRKISRAIEGALSRAGAAARRGRVGEYDGGSAAGPEERLAILRMLENGKISVAEAEELLRALEGEA